jgi:thymidylate synthase (FAD)
MKIADIKVDYVNHCGDDLSTCNAARVSFEKTSDWEVEEILKYSPAGNYTEDVKVLSAGDTKLINYLAKHKHKSPFNHSFISVRVKAPLSVARQLVKHKFMPWNEVSRRYVDSEPEFYIAPVYRARAESVKQGSADTDSGYDRHAAIEHSERCLDEYNARLAHGVCPEQARDALPINTMTEWFWSGTLGAFADMLVLRLSSYTQAETRIVAEQIRDIVQPLFPVSLKALLENN